MTPGPNVYAAFHYWLIATGIVLAVLWAAYMADAIRRLVRAVRQPGRAPEPPTGEKGKEG